MSTEPVRVRIDLAYIAVPSEEGHLVPMWKGRATVDGEQVDHVSSQSLGLLNGMAQRIAEKVQPEEPRAGTLTREGMALAVQVFADETST